MILYILYVKISRSIKKELWVQKVRMKMAEVVGAGEGLWYRNLLSYISPQPAAAV